MIIINIMITQINTKRERERERVKENTRYIYWSFIGLKIDRKWN